MRIFAAVFGLLFTLSGSCAEMTRGFVFRGGFYEMQIDQNLLSHVPRWTPSLQLNPPLAASKALEKATNFIAQVRKDDGYSFSFDSLNLRQCGSFWIWEAQWSYLQNTDKYQKTFEKMRCWILMDGTVVKPTSVKQAATKADAHEPTNAQASVSVWKPQALTSGLYEPDPRHTWFGGELITIRGTNFHYTRFTDVADVPRPHYTGVVVQLKDHILLDHPKVPNPERISGLLSNRPVLWVWDGYQEWKRLGLNPKPHEVLYLSPTRAERGSAANRSQPVRSETNQPSAVAGSAR